MLFPYPSKCAFQVSTLGSHIFAHSVASRFNAPGGGTAGTPEYQCRYLGLTFEVVLEEIQLHDAVSARGKFHITQPENDRRWAHGFSSIFNRMDLTGPLHKRLSAHAGLPGPNNFRLTQKRALAAHKNPQVIDGFFYMSRCMTDHKAVVLVDRAKGKLHALGKPKTPAKSSEMQAKMGAFRKRALQNHRAYSLRNATHVPSRSTSA